VLRGGVQRSCGDFASGVAHKEHFEPAASVKGIARGYSDSKEAAFGALQQVHSDVDLPTYKWIRSDAPSSALYFSVI
jgi:hypothetical protein